MCQSEKSLVIYLTGKQRYLFFFIYYYVIFEKERENQFVKFWKNEKSFGLIIKENLKRKLLTLNMT